MEVCYQLPVLPLDRPVPQHVLSRRGAISFSSSSALFGCPNPRQLSQVGTRHRGLPPAWRPAGHPPASPRRAAAGRRALFSVSVGSRWGRRGAAGVGWRWGRAAGLPACLPPRPGRRSRLPRPLPNTAGGGENVQRFMGLWLVIVEVIFLASAVMRAVNSLGFISRARGLFVSSVIFKLGLFSSFFSLGFL